MVFAISRSFSYKQSTLSTWRTLHISCIRNIIPIELQIYSQCSLVAYIIASDYNFHRFVVYLWVLCTRGNDESVYGDVIHIERHVVLYIYAIRPHFPINKDVVKNSTFVGIHICEQKRSFSKAAASIFVLGDNFR